MLKRSINFLHKTLLSSTEKGSVFKLLSRSEKPFAMSPFPHSCSPPPTPQPGAAPIAVLPKTHGSIPTTLTLPLPSFVLAGQQGQACPLGRALRWPDTPSPRKQSSQGGNSCSSRAPAADRGQVPQPQLITNPSLSLFSLLNFTEETTAKRFYTVEILLFLNGLAHFSSSTKS